MKRDQGWIEWIAAEEKRGGGNRYMAAVVHEIELGIRLEIVRHFKMPEYRCIRTIILARHGNIRLRVEPGRRASDRRPVVHKIIAQDAVGITGARTGIRREDIGVS